MKVFVKDFMGYLKGKVERPAPDNVLKSYRSHQLQTRLRARAQSRREGLAAAREKLKND
jgi:hypothetical protein